MLEKGSGRGGAYAAEGVVRVEAHTVVAETGQQLRLDGAVHGVVDALVYDGFDPALALADLADLRYLGRVSDLSEVVVEGILIPPTPYNC